MLLNQQSLSTILNSYHETAPVFQQKNGKLWLFGMPFLAEFDERQKKFIPVPNEYAQEQSINYERIVSLYEDRENNIWISTSDNGIFLFNPAAQLFKSVEHTNRFTNT